MFGVLDRLDGTGISQEDIRRAKALSNHAAMMLEVARNFHVSEQNRHRAEALIDLAREIDGALRLPEFARRFVTRAAESTDSRAGLLAILQDGQWQVIALHQKRFALAAPATTFSATPENLTQKDESHAKRTPFPETPQTSSEEILSRDLERKVSPALAEFVARNSANVISASAKDLISA